MGNGHGGRKLEDDYRLGHYLGCVRYGHVREAIHKRSGAKMACKILTSDPTKKEIRIWDELSGHRNILPLRCVYQDSNQTYVITDICKGGSLYNMIQTYGLFSEKLAAKVMKSLVKVLQYCHEKGIIHRDVRIDNILLPSKFAFEDIKLADFAWATRFSDDKPLLEYAGNPSHMAPEIMEEVGYSKEVDIWSAGVVLYVVLSGSFPYEGKDFHQLLRSIQKSDLNLKAGKWRLVSESAKDLIKGMLTKEVKKRLTTNEILDHPWLKDHTEDSVGKKKIFGFWG